MPGIAHLFDQRTTFDAVSSRHAHLDSASFRGRVPVVFAFVGAHGPRADAAIVALDRSLYRFSERQIRLLVVVDGHPSELAARLAVGVRLIIDDGLAEELDAQVDDQGRISSVILGNHGRVLDVVRHLPNDDQAESILFAVELLTAEFPERFGVLS